MNSFIIIVAIIIFTCVFLNNASFRIGMPVLLAFILLGMMFSNNGLIPMYLDRADKAFVGDVCTAALIFIMFYGGFGTSWKSAKPVAREAGLLATVGVLLTAGFVGIFCHFLLGWGWAESFLLGAVISSTDAASVFSILRARKLGLKNHISPLLEMESGSNDPMSYMLTIVMMSILKGEDATVGHTVWMLLAQLGFGTIFGLCISTAAVFVIRRIHFATPGFNSLFLGAVALLSYALPSIVGGNGYLSAYIVGLVLGNQRFEGKKAMVHFFDGITGLMQVIIFFMLGLLATPSHLHACIVPALAIFVVLTLIARPLSVAMILTPFHKRHYDIRQQLLISFCGLRGAASIVFAIMATVGNDALQNDIFNIVFCVVLISIALQGSLLPVLAKRLDVIDPDTNVLKTFSDFSEGIDLQFSEVRISPDSPWKDKFVSDIRIPGDLLFCLVVRPDGSTEIPKGSTVLHEGDIISMCSREFKGSQKVRITQQVLSEESAWSGMELKNLPFSGGQVLLVQRGSETIIPNGNTVLMPGDVLYFNKNTD